MSQVQLSYEEQVISLEEFVFNNETLEKLESIADKFNIFSSLGIINQEIRHSNFLAWLLDPQETHSLTAYFTNSFLKHAAYNDNNPNPDLSLIDIDTLDLSEVNVFREWNNIDILLVEDAQKVVCVIENKVDSKEHSNQLARYKKVVESYYPDYKKIFVYLTISGEEAESDKAYISISYQEVANLIERLLERKGSQMNDEIKIFITHYIEMIKRYIMEESEVQELCEQLYKKHKKALDLIFKHKPDVYSDNREVLEAFVDANDTLIKDLCTKSYTRFIPKHLDFVPKKGEGWTKSKRILLFEIRNRNKSVDLVLLIGPGESSIRKSIYDFASTDSNFKLHFGKLTKMWTTIYEFKLSTIASLEGQSKEFIEEKLSKKLEEFFNNDFPALEKSLLTLKGQFAKEV